MNQKEPINNLYRGIGIIAVMWAISFDLAATVFIAANPSLIRLPVFILGLGLGITGQMVCYAVRDWMMIKTQSRIDETKERL